MPYWLYAHLDSPYVVGSAAAVLALLVIGYLARRQPRSFRAFQSEGGEVHITRKAVRELVQTCCGELGDVGSSRARVFLRRGELQVVVELRVRRTVNLKAVSAYLRQQIAQALTENLGIEKLGDIEIAVVGVFEEAKAAD